jgi:nitroreductase
MDIYEALKKGMTNPRNQPAPDDSIRTAPTRDQLDAILQAARQAPSAYNTQPWYFQVLSSSDHRAEAAKALSLPCDPQDNAAWLLCHLDRTRMLPVADPLGTEPYLALGMACLNVQVASTALGLTCRVWGPFGSEHTSWRPQGFSFPESVEPYYLFEIYDGSEPTASVEQIPAIYRLDSFGSEPRHVVPPPNPSDGLEALACVHSRQSDRVPLFRGESWPKDSASILSAARRALESHGAGEVELLIAEAPQKTMALTHLQERAWRQATRDRGRFTETCGWFRFTQGEWKRRGDGELVDHLGLSGWRRTVAHLGLKTALAPLAMALGVDRFLLRTAERSPETTGAFLTACLENSGGQFESDEVYRRRILTAGGAALQSVWLTAAALGASLQFQTSTIVIPERQAELRKTLEIPDTHVPLFLIRMGYPERDPHYGTIRRKSQEVIGFSA